MASVALPPPKPPTDLIASALHLPLPSISTTSHGGRKLRFTGQVLAFDSRSSLVLLTAPRPAKPFPTVLVNISVPLLGLSPAARASLTSELPPKASDTTRGRSHEERTRSEGDGLVNRERLRLDRGEWVCVVGWLEGDDPRLLRKVIAPPSYAAPIGLVLEAIYISPARPPPDEATYPIIEAKDGLMKPSPEEVTRRRRRSTAADENATPRLRRKR